MKKEYNYYIAIIKPLEKKYNKICLLYSIFKLDYFKEKKKLYNLLLIIYYKKLQQDYTYTKAIEEEINKKNNFHIL